MLVVSAVQCTASKAILTCGHNTRYNAYMLIKRQLSNLIKKSKKSILLLGPRQTGKSTLIRSFQPDLDINLARETEYIKFARNPAELEQRLSASNAKTILIDEVQRLPSLLNTIQAVIDESPVAPKFYLTGSSARKLKRGQANLLPGRIHTYRLTPCLVAEFKDQFDPHLAMTYGTLPGILTEGSSREKQKTLTSYGATYLKEEIQAESLTRNLEGFTRFLYVCAAESTKFLDMTKLASEAGIPRQSAQRYFEILEETLVVNRSDAFSKSSRRRLIKHPRFFFFDNGVLNGLLENFKLSSDRKGMLFENLLFNQLFSIGHSLDEAMEISSYRTEHGAEIDFIVSFRGQTWAIEAKSSSNIKKIDRRGFKSFADYYGKPHTPLLAYMGDEAKIIDGVQVMPWVEIINTILAS
jgi:uncharacterized protein